MNHAAELMFSCDIVWYVIMDGGCGLADWGLCGKPCNGNSLLCISRHDRRSFVLTVIKLVDLASITRNKFSIPTNPIRGDENHMWRRAKGEDIEEL